MPPSSALASVTAIPLPLRHIGSVNAWLLAGDPLTLVDVGPANDEALVALEAGLGRHGVRLEDIELVLATHHHLDHVGLAAAVRARSGAQVAVLDSVADYGASYLQRIDEDRAFSHALMAKHGVPEAIIDDNEEFWEFQRENGADFVADLRLSDGDHVRAGGRMLRVISRPGHSTTDTLFVDDKASIAFVGDHILARISSNTEIYPPTGAAGRRPPSRTVYLQNLGLTAAMDLERLHTGHGDDITAHAALVRRRLSDHRRRCKNIVDALDSGDSTAFRLAEHLWSKRTTRHQPLLVVWEVLGHLELLMATASVAERVGDDGQIRFALTDGDEWVKSALARNN